MRRLFLLLLAAPFLLALAAAPALAQIAPPAGTVTRLQGTATAVRNAMPRVLTVGDSIQIGDVLSTGTEAVLEIKMSDDSLFTLGAETAFIVTDYTFGQGTGGATFRVIKGAFLATSGKIAQLAGNTMTVQTDIATIGSHLARDPRLAPLIAKRPGLRAPGDWERETVGVAGDDKAPPAWRPWHAYAVQHLRMAGHG